MRSHVQAKSCVLVLTQLVFSPVALKSTIGNWWDQAVGYLGFDSSPKGNWCSDAQAVEAYGSQAIPDEGNTAMTIALQVGKQRIRTVPDSGSFEIYILYPRGCAAGDVQEWCSSGSSYRPYDRSLVYNVSRELAFGSGVCYAQLGFDSVTVSGELSTQSPHPDNSTQSELSPLWLIDEMDPNLARVWGDANSFQGIFGMGYLQDASQEYRGSVTVPSNLYDAPDDVTFSENGPGTTYIQSDIVEAVEAVSERAATALATKADSSSCVHRSTIGATGRLLGDVFAICLPRGLESFDAPAMFGGVPKNTNNGMLWWGKSMVPNLSYLNVPVVKGIPYWSAMIDSAGSEDGKGVICESPCVGIVDSGTSLLALPWTSIEDVILGTNLLDLDPYCGNVKEMPNLVFKFSSGQSITLTPETYIMGISKDMLTLDGKIVLGAKRTIRTIPLSNAKYASKLHGSGSVDPRKASFISTESGSKGQKFDEKVCTFAFMETSLPYIDLDSFTRAEALILGMPLFREYTVKFDRDSSSMGFASHPTMAKCHSIVSDTNANSAAMSLARHKKSLVVLSDSPTETDRPTQAYQGDRSSQAPEPPARLQVLPGDLGKLRFPIN